LSKKCKYIKYASMHKAVATIHDTIKIATFIIFLALYYV
jgi:hypothetical protein